MRKITRILALCIVLLLSAAAPAAAAEPEEAGFYGVGSAEGLEIVPLSEAGTAVSAVARNVDGIDGDEVFYPGSRSLRILLTGTEPGKEYLLTLSAGEAVLYVDQRAGGGTIGFAAAFLLPAARTELTLRVGSSAVGFSPISVTLYYTPGTTDGKATSTAPGGSAGAAEFDPSACLRDETCVMAAFSDLDASAWYHDGVHYALESGIMNGVGEGSFAPASPASRAMIVTILWRMEGEPVSDAAMPFTDVAERAWYAEAVRWATSERIVNGHSADRFAPGDPVSREQLAAILWRYASRKGLDTTSAAKVNLGIFIDAEHISGWAYDGMQWAVDTGLVSGVGNEKLSPETNASRAQIATILMRFSRL